MRTVFSDEVNCQQILSELREALPNNSEIKLVDYSKKYYYSSYKGDALSW